MKTLEIIVRILTSLYSVFQEYQLSKKEKRNPDLIKITLEVIMIMLS